LRALRHDVIDRSLRRHLERRPGILADDGADRDHRVKVVGSVANAEAAIQDCLDRLRLRQATEVRHGDGHGTRRERQSHLRALVDPGALLGVLIEDRVRWLRARRECGLDELDAQLVRLGLRLVIGQADEIRDDDLWHRRCAGRTATVEQLEREESDRHEDQQGEQAGHPDPAARAGRALVAIDLNGRRATGLPRRDDGSVD
jgi:hypothetical protein